LDLHLASGVVTEEGGGLKSVFLRTFYLKKNNKIAQFLLLYNWINTTQLSTEIFYIVRFKKINKCKIILILHTINMCTCVYQDRAQESPRGERRKRFYVMVGKKAIKKYTFEYPWSTISELKNQ
jgi:hypothetical protein